MKLKKIRKIKKIKKVKKLNKFKKFEPTISKIEVIFGDFLKKLGLEIEPQFRIGYKFFDFKIKDKNIILEFDGDFYHRNPETQGHYPANAMQRKNMKNDKYKTALAEGNGFRLLRIWENDFNTKKISTAEKILKFINE